MLLFVPHQLRLSRVSLRPCYALNRYSTFHTPIVPPSTAVIASAPPPSDDHLVSSLTPTTLSDTSVAAVTKDSPNHDPSTWSSKSSSSSSSSTPLIDTLTGQDAISVDSLMTAVVENGQASTALGVPWSLVAAALVGLPVILWSYKCAMMILFQRSIIYMGYLPPLSRTTRFDPKDPTARGLDVREVEVESEPHGRVTLRGLEIRPVSKLAAQQRPKISSASPLDVGALSDDSQRDERNDQLEKLGPENVVIYFQGNMGSPLGRLPKFRHLLTSPHSPFSSSSSSNPSSPPPSSLSNHPSSARQTKPHTHQRPHTYILAIPPRSYYLSTNRTPTQSGLLQDYKAVLAYAERMYPDARRIVYGHSLGGAAACCLLNSLPSRLDHHHDHPSVPSTPDDRLSTDVSPASPSPPPPSITMTTTAFTTNTSSHGSTLNDDDGDDLIHIDALILENPFPSIPRMVKSMYPQRWLPYHYLGPFALDRWDALDALSTPSPSFFESSPPSLSGSGKGLMDSRSSSSTAAADADAARGRKRRRRSVLMDVPILFVSSEKDSVVPPSLVREMYQARQVQQQQQQQQQQEQQEQQEFDLPRDKGKEKGDVDQSSTSLSSLLMSHDPKVPLSSSSSLTSSTGILPSSCHPQPSSSSQPSNPPNPHHHHHHHRPHPTPTEWLSIPRATHDDAWSSAKRTWGEGVKAFLDRSSLR